MTQDQSAQTDQSGGLRELIRDKPLLARVLGAIIIIVATLLAYVPAMRGEFIWDDDYYVTNNALLKSWEGLQRIWFEVIPDPSVYSLPQYYPLTHTTFWIEYRLWGLNPAGYHTVNVILHIANALLVWLLLRKLSVPGAWLAGALFALHPINVESVAWIAERKNVLSLLFYLSSLYVYLRYAGIIKGRENKPLAPLDETQPTKMEWFTLPDDPQRLYALAAALFVFALFSKTITSSMPAVALLIIWWKRGRVTVKDVTPLLPLFAVGLAMGMLTAYMERVRVGVAARPHEWDYAPTLLGEFGARSMIAGKVIWFYIGKLFFPYPLVFNYERWQIDPANVSQYVYLLAAIAVLVALMLGRKRFGNGPLVAALFYGITLFPAMGFFDVWPMQYSFVADHFVYISSIGVLAFVAAIVARYLTLETIAGVATVVLLVFFGLSFSQARMYENLNTLWKTTLERTNQNSWMAANNYGAYLLENGDLNVAEAWFKRVLRLKPNHVEARRNLARVATRRALLAENLRARAATNPTTQLTALIPTTLPSEYYEEAIRWYKQALEYEPNYVDANYFLGELLLSLKRTDEGVAYLQRTIKIYPRHFAAHMKLGSLALQADKTQEAIEHFISAVEIQPDDPAAHANLGTALLQAGRVGDGFAQWEDTMRLAPNDPSWPNMFGARMLLSEQYNKAIDYLRNRALQIDPNYVPAITNFGIVAAKTGYPERAEALFNQALKLDPDFAPAKENLEALLSGRLKPATMPATTQSATSPTTQAR